MDPNRAGGFGAPARRSRVLTLARAVGPRTLLVRIGSVIVALVGVVLVAAGIGGLVSASTVDDLRHASGAHTVVLSVDSVDRHCHYAAGPGSGTLQQRTNCTYAVTGHYTDTDGRPVSGVSLYPDASRSPGPTLPVIVSPGHRTTALDASASAHDGRVIGGIALGVGAALVLGVAVLAVLAVRRRRRV